MLMCDTAIVCYHVSSICRDTLRRVMLCQSYESHSLGAAFCRTDFTVGLNLIKERSIGAWPFYTADHVAPPRTPWLAPARRGQSWRSCVRTVLCCARTVGYARTVLCCARTVLVKARLPGSPRCFWFGSDRPIKAARVISGKRHSIGRQRRRRASGARKNRPPRHNKRSWLNSGTAGSWERAGSQESYNSASVSVIIGYLTPDITCAACVGVAGAPEPFRRGVAGQNQAIRRSASVQAWKYDEAGTAEPSARFGLMNL